MSETLNLPPLPEGMRWKIEYRTTTSRYDHYNVLLQKECQPSWWDRMVNKTQWATVEWASALHDYTSRPINPRTRAQDMREGALQAYHRWTSTANPRDVEGTYYPRLDTNDNKG